MTKVDYCLKSICRENLVLADPTAGVGKGFKNFGQDRISKKSGKKYKHSGIDIAVPVGTEIHAAENGLVWRKKPASGYGDLIVIKHNDHLFTVYAHLSRVDVDFDEPVKKGDVIGRSGNSGESTGPHLHFEVVDFSKSPDRKIEREKDNFGIDSDNAIRIDPFDVLSPMKAGMLSVSHGEAFKKSAIPSGIIGAFATGLSLSAFGTMIVPVDAWISLLSSLGLGSSAAGITHGTIKGSLQRKAEKRLAEVRTEIGFSTSDIEVDSALAEAERSGKSSLNQHRKILSSIRGQISAARGAIGEVSSKISDLHNRIESIDRELDSVKRNVSSAATSIDKRKLEEAKSKAESLSAERRKVEVELRQAHEDAKEAGNSLTESERRADAALEAKTRQLEAAAASGGSSNRSDGIDGNDSTGGQSGGDGDIGDDYGIRLRDSKTGEVLGETAPFDDEVIEADETQ